MRSRESAAAAREWLRQEAAGITNERRHLKPSEHAEEVRYLPAHTTPYPGPFSLSLNPFMREPLDCFDIESPVREVTMQKGVQITYTTILECIILYCMDHVKSCPVMFMTADKELAQARIENNVLPMINASGLGHLIRSADEGNKRKTGKTKDALQWEGPGVLWPFGANNADKMRMYSVWFLLKDELDAWPARVGKDGDPDKLSDDRCAAYWEKRKIFRGSTPLVEPSKISDAYKRGDQRHYKVRCRSCGFPQALRWEGVSKETGLEFGIKYELENGILLPESVHYVCENCGHQHYEHDKTKLFDPAEGAEWVPTATPVEAGIRSYFLPALYSPAGMQSWAKCVGDYLRAYDPVAKRMRNIDLYQQFYNNILATPFSMRAGTVSYEVADAHRRQAYSYGMVPNEYAEEHCNARISFLICTVDVQKDYLSVAVFGYTKGERAFLIDYDEYHASVKNDEDPEFIPSEDLSDPATWRRLAELIELKEYEADDGRKYRVLLTLIDSNYLEDTVSSFCSNYPSNVYPIIGRSQSFKRQRFDEFGEFKTKNGIHGYALMVNRFKDRMSSSLRNPWDQVGVQPERCLNLPQDATQKQIKELTAEYRRQVKDDKTGKVLGHEWYRKSGADNELWDLWGYSLAGVSIVAYLLFIVQYEQESVNWVEFWEIVEGHALYFTPPSQ